MIIVIEVKPNSKVTQVIGKRESGTIRIAIQAPAKDGKANKALITVLSKHLGIAPSRIRIKRGARARIKHIEIPNGTILPF